MSAFFRLLPLLPLGLPVSLLGLYGGIHLLHGVSLEGLRPDRGAGVCRALVALEVAHASC